MTRRHPGFLRFFVLLLAASSGLWAAQSFAQSEQVSVSYSLESSTTTMHEPVIVRVNILNGSKQPITLRLGLDRKESFSLAIKWPDGSAHTRPATPLREGAFDPGNVSLAAGETLHHRLLLNEWTSFPTPGEYELEARLLTPIEMSSGATIVSKPYHTSFKVLPQDESLLRAACERLVQQLEATDAVRAANDAASALAYIDDPLVVPYLERALRSGRYVEHRVIDGLTRIGNEDAARILIAVIKESPAWPPNADTLAGTRAILAWQALQAMAAATSNERLRQEIQRTMP